MQTITENYLEQAALKASKPDFDGDESSLREELARLKRLKSLRLGVENREVEGIDQKIIHLALDLVKHRVVRRYAGNIALLDPATMTWRDDNGFPRLVPFRPDNPQIIIGIHGNLPDCTRVYFNDVLERFKDRSKGELRLTVEFGGLIPESVRAKIRQARGFFVETFILTEVQHWAVEYVQVQRTRIDPLVVGWDGHHFWLIDKFDTTSLEEYVSAEFATKAAKRA